MTEITPTLTGDPPPEAQPTLLEVYGTPRLYGTTLYDDRGRTSFIKQVVTTCRRSPEMARYRSFLVENLDMHRCAVLSQLTDEECAAGKLELHHWPISLFSVVELVLGQMEYDEERITTFAVAHRVMAYHWRGMVGLVPLMESIHQMAHAMQLQLDPRWAYGNWQGLLNECRAGMTEELATRLAAEFASWGREEAAETNARLLQVLPQRWTAVPVTAARLLASPTEEAPDVPPDL